MYGYKEVKPNKGGKEPSEQVELELVEKVDFDLDLYIKDIVHIRDYSIDISDYKRPSDAIIMCAIISTNNKKNSITVQPVIKKQVVPEIFYNTNIIILNGK